MLTTDTALFTHNVTLLEKYDRCLADRLRAWQGVSHWRAIMAKNGSPTLEGMVNDSPYLLHSKYDPQKEAAQLAATFVVPPTADLVCLGFGMGYHLEHLLARGGKHGVIVIVEPDLAVIALAFRSRNLEPLLTLTNILWSVAETPERLFNKLRDHTLSILANSMTVVEHPASTVLHPEYYQAVRQTISELYTWAKVNVNTQIAKAETFTANVLTNLREIVMSTGIKKLEQAFAGCPAFIVSAGPSLDKNVHYLRHVGERGLIIAVDAAVKTLLAHDIVPDLILSIDFSHHVLTYLNDLTTEKLVLVYDPEVQPEILKRFSGKKFVMPITGKSLCVWMQSVIGDRGSIEKGLSVSHSAFFLAQYIGADPIVFLGQDLSYPRSKWHSKYSSMYQRSDTHIDLQRRMRTIDGYFGGTVTSETSLIVFRNHFESMFTETKGNFYNATEGGASIKGLEPITLRDAIARFCLKPIAKHILCEQDQEPHERYMQQLYEAGVRAIERLTTCNHNAHAAVERIEQMLNEIHRVSIDRALLMRYYQTLIDLGKKCSYDQELFVLLKDSALEAILIRSKRDIISFTDNTLPVKEFEQMLTKERLFFVAIVKATDTLVRLMCQSMNALRTAALSCKP